MSSTDSDIQQQGDALLFELIFGRSEDPAPTFRALRELAPVHRSGNGTTFLSGFSDCQALLRDNRFGKDATRQSIGLAGSNASPELTEFRREQAERAKTQQQSMLSLNPPDHTRLRSLVSRGFTPRRIESMRDSIRSLTEDCLDDMTEAGTGDAIEILGNLPVYVIGLLVGVPRSEWDRFRILVTSATASLEPGATLEELRESRAAFEEMYPYFVDLVEQRRQHREDDLISALLDVEDQGDTLTTPELLSTVQLLFAAGMETTQNLIGNGLGALLKNPDQLDRLWADPSLVPSAVDEMLRWDSPVQIDGRIALEPAEIAGRDMPESSSVITLLGGANRDPSQFTNPDAFDIGRSEGQPISFGSGIHYCLGANLAKAEGQEIFAGLVRRFSKIEQAGDLKQRGRLTLKGYETVPITVTPR